MTELKPCPFCGGEAQLEHEYGGVGYSYVRCKRCGLKSVTFLRSFECSSDDNAVEYWNRRVDNERKD